MGEDSTGKCCRWSQGEGTCSCAGGQPGDTEGLWSTGTSLGAWQCVTDGTWQCLHLAGTGARGTHPARGSSKPWAKPTGRCQPPSATSHPHQCHPTRSKPLSGQPTLPEAEVWVLPQAEVVWILTRKEFPGQG